MTGNGSTDWTVRRQQDCAQFLNDFVSALHNETVNSEQHEKINKLLSITIIDEFICAGHTLNNCHPKQLSPTIYPCCLPIPALNSNSLEHSLSELLCVQNHFERKCSQCPEDTGECSTKIQNEPEIMSFQFQRFSFDNLSNKTLKINHPIQIPMTLSLPYPDEPVYNLASAIVHSGTPSNGHYISLVRCPVSGRIFQMDDQKAPTIYDESTDLLNQAYVVIYSKKTKAVHTVNDVGPPIKKKQRISVESDVSACSVQLNASNSNEKTRCSDQDVCRDDAMFEAIMSKITSNSIDKIIAQLNLKRQTGLKRRIGDVRSYYAKHRTERKRILEIMVEPIPKSSEIQSAPSVSQPNSQLSNTSMDIDLPSPTYIPIYAESAEPGEQRIGKEDANHKARSAAGDNNAPIGSLLSMVDGTTLNRILCKYGLTPQTSMATRRHQLKQLYNNNCDFQKDIYQCLHGMMKNIIYSSAEDIFYDCNEAVPNEQEVERDSQQGPDGDIGKRLDGSQDDELPTPPYVSINQHRESASDIPVTTKQVETDDNRWNIDTWTRDSLLKYTTEHLLRDPKKQNITDLQIKVKLHIFDSLMSDFDTSKLNDLLCKYRIKKQSAFARQVGQIRAFFMKNKNNQIDILNFLENNKKQPEQNISHNPQPSHQNDFFPENFEEIKRKRELIKAERARRIEGLKTGDFHLDTGPGTNLILEAGREMHEALREIKSESCVVCRNQWFDINVGPRSGKCQRCSGERLKKNIPPTFSAKNDMDPGLAPTCLRILNSVEVAAISLICPQLTIYKLKGGASGIKGHSISFYQDIQGFVNRLPHRPEDLPIIVIKAPNQNIELKANRFKILNALEFLIQKNPEYGKIAIDEEALSSYPADSITPVPNIRACDAAETVDARPSEPEDIVVDDNTGVLDDADLVQTAAPFDVPTRLASDQIRQAVLGEDHRPANLRWPDRTGPASEWEYAYFSKAFPNLFPYGQGDISKPRIGKKPEFLQYIRHLTRLPDTQFAEDPRFLLHVISMYRRHKALTLGNVFASNVFKDMTMSDLKEKVKQDDAAVMKSLILFTAQIPGTKGYFSQEAKKSVAMERWIRLKSHGEEMLNVFLTFSLPDQHLEDLHRLLPGNEQYLGKIVVKDLSDIPSDADPDLYIDKKTDFLLRRKAVHDNGHIVDYFGSKRMDLLIEKVLHNTMGMTDHIMRSEYQARKAVHWHMAARMPGLGLEDIQRACKKYDFDVRVSTEEEQLMSQAEMDEYRKDLRKEGIDMDKLSTEETKQEVAASRQRVIDFTTQDLGLSACHPQPDPKLWPGPEGQDVSAPATNCLRENFLNITDLETDYEHLINRAMLHACRITYCIIESAFRRERRPDKCRFGYPLTLYGFIQRLLEVDGHQIWNEIERDPEFQDGAEFVYGTLEILRNHPRLVCHVPELLSLWRGNIDMKLIKSPETLLKYILKYMMKPEQNSNTFESMIKKLTENADETTPTRKIFQKIMLKSVGEHDISKNEAWRIINGKPFVQYSRPFRNLNLTESRRVNLEANDEHSERQVLSKNFCDVYWEKDSSEHFSRFCQQYEQGQVVHHTAPNDISLYDFASDFTMQWRPSPKMHVPKPTPMFHYVPLPSNEEYRRVYCETTLLLHKPGVNRGNLTEGYTDAEAALNDFVNNDTRCPKVVKDEFIKSLKMTPLQAEQLLTNVENLVPSQGSQTVQLAQEDWMVGLGEPIRQPDLNDPEPEIEDMDDENVDAQWDKDADWTSDKRMLGLNNQQIDDARNWIKQKRVSADLDVADEESIDVDTLNSEQTQVFTKIMDAVLPTSGQELIDVSGGAGTGKSYLIRAILQHSSEEIMIVKIAAPTGCAAQQFTGGQTLHSLFRIPPKKGCKELDKLSPRVLAELQLQFKDTRALIIDEKGMIGLGRLAQISSRLKEIRPDYADQPFGGLTILLAGDLRQLPPIGDLSMYSESGGDMTQCLGRGLYRMFDKSSYSLTAQMRQQGDENAGFRNELERLATGEFSLEDWHHWQDQNYDTMDEETKNNFFGNATLLCAKKIDSVSFNHKHLKLTKNPIAQLTAKNSHGAASFDADQAQGLRNKIYVAKEAKIVLTSNLWPEAKLVNGSQGTVKYIIYKDGRKDLPDLILCSFPNYIGPSYIPGEDQLVPIAPIEATWFSKNSPFSRMQYPLILSWALTIHKAQGRILKNMPIT